MIIKAAIAVWLACSSWDVQPPERCINELIDCWRKTDDAEACQKEILERYEPRPTRFAGR